MQHAHWTKQKSILPLKQKLNADLFLNAQNEPKDYEIVKHKKKVTSRYVLWHSRKLYTKGKDEDDRRWASRVKKVVFNFELAEPDRRSDVGICGVSAPCPRLSGAQNYTWLVHTLLDIHLFHIFVIKTGYSVLTLMGGRVVCQYTMWPWVGANWFTLKCQLFYESVDTIFMLQTTRNDSRVIFDDNDFKTRWFLVWKTGFFQFV